MWMFKNAFVVIVFKEKTHLLCTFRFLLYYDLYYENTYLLKQNENYYARQ